MSFKESTSSQQEAREMTSSSMKKFANGIVARNRVREVTGALSGKTIRIPDVSSGYPRLNLVGGKNLVDFKIDPTLPGFEGYPDVRSHRLKLGLLIPSTNTSMESELWSLIYRNQPALKGVGLHTSNVITPKPKVGTKEGVLQYRRDFLAGLKTATQQALQAEPQYLIIGMSLEHILENLSDAKEPIEEVQQTADLGISVWHDAAKCALDNWNARKISLLTPFESTGNTNARKFFEKLGFEVVNIVGMGCGSTVDIAHVPDWAKEKVIREELLYCNDRSRENEKVDAIVQCGTNFSMCDVAEKLEKEIDIPIVGINAALLWHALRELGIQEPLVGGGRLLREF